MPGFAPRRAWTPVAPPAGDPPPKGPYTPAVRAGEFVFVSGQTPRDPATGEIVGDTIEAQSRQTLANVERVLAAAGAVLADVVSVTVYLTSVDDWDAFNAVYRERFGEPYPTRTVVGASLRGILVEVSAVAYTAPRG
jgi:2-iminobutanoate/2-iminopropanoate deaminase